jgi:hypothetical protein
MHFHPSTIPTSVRIGSSAELLPDYFSREGLVQTTSFPFTPIVPTFVFESTSSLAFSAAVRPYFSASRISLTTDSFRVRSVFARRLRSSRICAFFPHLAVRNNFISQPSLFSRR